MQKHIWDQLYDILILCRHLFITGNYHLYHQPFFFVVVLKNDTVPLKQKKKEEISRVGFSYALLFLHCRKICK